MYEPTDFEPFTDADMREIFMLRDLEEWAKNNPEHRNASRKEWDYWLATHDAAIRRRVLSEAENAAADALTQWFVQETLPEDDTSAVMDVRLAIRALRVEPESASDV